MTPDALPIIGRSALITLHGIEGVAAKVDTGADSSSVWATNIREQNGELHFTLFGPGSNLYTATPLVTKEYETVRVASSNGERNLRFVVHFPVQVGAVRYDQVRFTLADRATMVYPVLLGRHFLSGSFLIDTSAEIPSTVHDRLKQERDERLQRSAVH